MPVHVGQVLTDTGWRSARMVIEAGRIAALEPVPPLSGPLIIPGFVDLHCHGGGGADVMDGGDAVVTVARTHARFGTTALLATTMTAPVEEIETALRGVRAHQATPPDAAAVLGVHLEGPFISGTRLGAQPNFPLSADLHLMQGFCDLAEIRVATVAPEADPDGALARFLRARSIRVQLGHSSCDYETAAALLCDDLDGVTHLFNAMTPLHHRAPGIAGAALAHAQHAEFIPDLVHVHPGAIHAALRAIPRAYAVTDGTAASGMPDGDYHLGRQTVRKCQDSVRLSDGTLAGSCLTMHGAFRNLVSIGLSIEEASRRTSTIAADYLGIRDRGRLCAGAWADYIVLDQDIKIADVVLRGASVNK